MCKGTGKQWDGRDFDGPTCRTCGGTGRYPWIDRNNWQQGRWLPREKEILEAYGPDLYAAHRMLLSEGYGRTCEAVTGKWQRMEAHARTRDEDSGC